MKINFVLLYNTGWFNIYSPTSSVKWPFPFRKLYMAAFSASSIAEREGVSPAVVLAVGVRWRRQTVAVAAERRRRRGTVRATSRDGSRHRGRIVNWGSVTASALVVLAGGADGAVSRKR